MVIHKQIIIGQKTKTIIIHTIQANRISTQKKIVPDVSPIQRELPAFTCILVKTTKSDSKQRQQQLRIVIRHNGDDLHLLRLSISLKRLFFRIKQIHSAAVCTHPYFTVTIFIHRRN